jgi:hypothetical protein
MPNSWLANLDWTYSSDQISFWQMTVTYHTAFSRFASATTLALEILGYFVLDRSLQQLPRSFAQELFQIAFASTFTRSWSEVTLTSIRGASFLFGSSGEAAVGFFFY